MNYTDAEPEYEYEQKQATAETHNAYEELIRQVDRATAIAERFEQKLAPVLDQPSVRENVPKRDRFPSALGEQVSRLSDRLDTLDEILRRVDL